MARMQMRSTARSRLGSCCKKQRMRLGNEMTTLTPRDARQHVLLQVHRGLDHVLCTTARTQAPGLAAQRDEDRIVAAAGTAGTRNSVRPADQMPQSM